MSKTLKEWAERVDTFDAELDAKGKGNKWSVQLGPNSCVAVYGPRTLVGMRMLEDILGPLLGSLESEFLARCREAREVAIRQLEIATTLRRDTDKRPLEPVS